MPNPFIGLLYGPSWGRSAVRLAGALGITEVHEDDPEYRFSTLVRWGNVVPVRYRSHNVINKRRAIVRSSDKYGANIILQEAGINCPAVGIDFDSMVEEHSFPLLGRNRYHFGGTGVKLYMQRADLQTQGESQYYMPYIPKTNEWRFYVGAIDNLLGLHIVDGLEESGLLNHEPLEVTSHGQSAVTLKVSEKLRLREPRNDLTETRSIIQDIIWNWDAGFSYRRAISDNYLEARYMACRAVIALGLDFGAVDVMRSEQGEYYVMEVNTAPALESDHTLSVVSSYIRSRALGIINVQESEEYNAEA